MFIVECGRGYSKDLERFDVFDCSGSPWPWLMALGVRYGWTSKGTVFAGGFGTPQSAWHEQKQDYQPVDWLCAKVFFADAAAGLAAALERTLPDLRAGKVDLASSKPSCTLFQEDMTEEALLRLNAPVALELVEEFIDFLRRGEFHFAYDD